MIRSRSCRVCLLAGLAALAFARPAAVVHAQDTPAARTAAASPDSALQRETIDLYPEMSLFLEAGP